MYYIVNKNEFRQWYKLGAGGKKPKTKQKTLPIRYIQALISGFIKILFKFCLLLVWNMKVTFLHNVHGASSDRLKENN